MLWWKNMTSDGKRIAVNVLLPEEIYEKLSELRTSEGITLSSFIRLAVQDRLDSWTPPNERPY